MKKLRLLLDVDEVLCFSGFLELVNEFLGTKYEIDDFHTYYIDEAAIPEERMKEFNAFCRDKDQYANQKLLPGALEALSELKEHYDIFVCSDCRNPFDLENSGRIFSSKFNYLFKNIPQDIIPAKNYIFTGSKKMFKADAQVDDLINNLDSEIPLKILFPSYHNREVNAFDISEQGIYKAGEDWRNGWEETKNILIEYAKTHQAKEYIKQ